MVKAIWNDKVVAESNATVVVDGNHYFPPEALERSYFQSSEKTSHCPWKGDARYYSLVVDGKTNEDAAWYYETPKTAAAAIRDHVAFWRGVAVTED